MRNQFYEGIHSRYESINSADLKVHYHNQEDQFCINNIYALFVQELPI